MELSEIKAQMELVARARENVGVMMEERRKSYKQWQAENDALLSSLTLAEETVAEQEEKLRELTLAYYEETKEKKPCPGVEIKLFKTMRYEEADALTWAKVHGVALRLDKKIFEGLAQVDTPDFVAISEEPRAQIAKELKTEGEG